MEVFPRLFLGNKHDASNPNFIESNSIFYILNVTDDIKNHFENVSSALYRKEMDYRGLQRLGVQDISINSSSNSINDILSQEDSINDSLHEDGPLSQTSNESFTEKVIHTSVRQDLYKPFSKGKLVHESLLSDLISDEMKDIDKNNVSITNNEMIIDSNETENIKDSSSVRIESMSIEVSNQIVETSSKLSIFGQLTPTSQDSLTLGDEFSQSSLSAPQFVDSVQIPPSFHDILVKVQSEESLENIQSPNPSSSPSSRESMLKLSVAQGKRTEIVSNIQDNIPLKPLNVEPIHLTVLQEPVKSQLNNVEVPIEFESSIQIKEQSQFTSIKFSQPIIYKRISIKDSFDENIFKYLDEAVNFIDQALKSTQDGKESACLVHCREGKSRSVSCIIAYAMKILSKSLQQAYNYIEEIAQNHIRINDGFKRQLMRYERYVFGLETNSLDFFPKDRNKRVREYTDLYADLYDSSESEEEGSQRKRRKVYDYDDDEDLLWSPDLEKRKRRKEYEMVKFLDVDHNFDVADGKKQLTLFDMFKKPRKIENNVSNDAEQASERVEMTQVDEKDTNVEKKSLEGNISNVTSTISTDTRLAMEKKSNPLDELKRYLKPTSVHQTKDIKTPTKPEDVDEDEIPYSPTQSENTSSKSPEKMQKKESTPTKFKSPEKSSSHKTPDKSPRKSNRTTPDKNKSPEKTPKKDIEKSPKKAESENIENSEKIKSPEKIPKQKPIVKPKTKKPTDSNQPTLMSFFNKMKSRTL